jgi:membrane-associated phospholipid phosphatase
VIEVEVNDTRDADDRHDDPAVRPTGRLSAPLAARSADAPPGLVPFAVLVAGYVALVVVLIAVGELVTHGGLLSGLRSWDDDVARWLADHRTGSLDTITEWLSRGADTMGVIAFAAVVEIVVLIQRRWWALILVPVALGLELVTFLTVNAVVGRPRPDVSRLGSEPSTSSFPSGHTAATVALWGAVVLLFVWSSVRRNGRLVCGVVVALLAVAVGTARIYRGMHHPSDVVCGALMGLAALAITMLALRVLVGDVRARRDADHDAPMAAPSSRPRAVSS